MIDRFLHNEELRQPSELRLPHHYIEPAKTNGTSDSTKRTEVPRISIDRRKREFTEVEMALSVDEATQEATRCLRCDLEFTMKKEEKQSQVLKEKTA